ncbi:hypothetical protein TH15_20290 [Thalassospira profundimaris]|nr:hypothetical protein TH15_20290 [Thalassospira profundimaris]
MAVNAMIRRSGHMVVSASKMSKPETKAVTRTAAVTKTRIVRQDHNSVRHKNAQHEHNPNPFMNSHRRLIDNTTEISAENHMVHSALAIWLTL